MLFGQDTPLTHRAWIFLRGVFAPTRPPKPDGVRTLVMGHRGLARSAPENTVASFQLAIEAGADGMEVDVCVTRDGQPVAWHDRDPDEAVALLRQGCSEGLPYVPRVPARGTAARRPVGQLTLAELRSTYGYRRVPEVALAESGIEAPEWPIDTLEACLRWAAAEPRVASMFLDLKVAPAEGALLQPLLDLLQRLGAAAPRLRDQWIVIITPHLEIHELLHQQLVARRELGWVQLAPDFEKPGVVRGTPRNHRPRIASIGITARRFWLAERQDIMEALVARARGDLDKVIVWTANDAHRIETLVGVGVDAIVTDAVREAKRIAGRLSGVG